MKAYAIATTIKDDSWLNDKRHKTFKAAWEYASTQTLAITAMSKITPEQAYYLHEALKKGEARAER